MQLKAVADDIPNGLKWKRAKHAATLTPQPIASLVHARASKVRHHIVQGRHTEPTG